MPSSYSWIPAGLALAMLFSGGCGPTTEEERAIHGVRKSEAEQRDALRRALDGATEKSVAIKLVQTAPAAQGEGTMEQWLQRQSSTNGSSIVFPVWEADRRGMGKYEVSFTCTLMLGDGSIGKWGVVWSVDILLKQVSSPREMTQSELNARSSSYFRDRRRGISPEQLNVD